MKTLKTVYLYDRLDILVTTRVVVKLALSPSANFSLIFLKPTNLLHTSIERYFYRASAHFLLHQKFKIHEEIEEKSQFIYYILFIVIQDPIKGRPIKILLEVCFSLIPGLEPRRSHIQVLTKPSAA